MKKEKEIVGEKEEKKSQKKKVVIIEAPKFVRAEFLVEGTAPYVQGKMSEKAQMELRNKMGEGQSAGSRKKRDARDYDDDYLQSHYLTVDNKYAIPSSAFRGAMVAACRTTDVKMTFAKQAFRVVPDSFDKNGFGMTYISGKPEKVEHWVPNANGNIDCRVRTMFKKWCAVVQIEFNERVLRLVDVGSLLALAGAEVGIGCGRPGSKKSPGCGWGTFKLAEEPKE